jgi:hypothetical protein
MLLPVDFCELKYVWKWFEMVNMCENGLKTKATSLQIQLSGKVLA